MGTRSTAGGRKRLPTLKDIHRLARERLGFNALRPDQEAVVAHLLADRDVMAVLPTGGGKSAIYQLAGIVIGGSTVIVSPLIALQADQVLHIEGSSLPPGAVLNSHTTVNERRRIFADLASEKLEYLLLAPEQLLNAETLAALRAHPPGLFRRRRGTLRQRMGSRLSSGLSAARGKSSTSFVVRTVSVPACSR